jgi:hypothetical protein
MGVIRLLPQITVETRYTRDWPTPISAEEYEMDCGWRSIPVPPTEDPAWEIFDTSRDRRTGWRRRRISWCAL